MPTWWGEGFPEAAACLFHHRQDLSRTGPEEPSGVVASRPAGDRPSTLQDAIVDFDLVSREGPLTGHAQPGKMIKGINGLVGPIRNAPAFQGSLGTSPREPRGPLEPRERMIHRQQSRYNKCVALATTNSNFRHKTCRDIPAVRHV
jgi:hypothetical protein